MPVRRQRMLTIEGDQADPFTHSSDARVAGGVSGDCVLCENPATLLLSHIVPRWAYKWAKAEGTMIGHYRSLGVTALTQDGTKHYLCCAGCEQHLGQAEEYLARLCAPGGGPRAIRATYKAGEIDGLQLNLMLRGLLGIAFKAHAATGAPFHNVAMSEDLAAEVASWIRSDFFPLDRLRVVATRWWSVVVPDINPRAMVLCDPLGGPRADPWMCDMTFGGWSWTVCIHDVDAATALDDLPALVGDAVAVVLDGDITDHRVVRGMDDEDDPGDDAYAQHQLKLVRARAPRRRVRSGRVQRNDTCPCGSGWKFKTCCKPAWYSG